MIRPYVNRGDIYINIIASFINEYMHEDVSHNALTYSFIYLLRVYIYAEK
jgi:hypothetical protein